MYTLINCNDVLLIKKTIKINHTCYEGRTENYQRYVLDNNVYFVKWYHKMYDTADKPLRSKTRRNTIHAHLSSEILEDSWTIDCSSSSNSSMAGRPTLQVTMNPSNRKL